MEQTQQETNPQSQSNEEKVINVDTLGEKKAGEAEGQRQVEVLHDRLTKRFAAKRGQPEPEAKPEPTPEPEAKADEQPQEETATKVEKVSKLELAARKERKAHEERMRIQRERQEIEQEKAKLAEAMKLAQAKAAKDYDALLDGVDETELYTKLTKKYIGGELQSKQEAPQMDKATQERLDRLEQDLNAEKYQKAVGVISNALHGASDKYQYILTTGSEHVVYDVILEHYSKNGRVLSWEEAADITEQYLESEHESKAQVRDKIRAAKAKPAPEPEKPVAKPQSKTISTQVARKAPVADTSFKARNPDEARRAIIDRIRNRAKHA